MNLEVWNWFSNIFGIFSGDSDAKVLTLAEHIIAAMPERIKVGFKSLFNTL